MSVLPDAAPLDDPPGEPAAVLDAARGARAAAGLLHDLADGVATARATAWQGADARALHDRGTTVSRVSAEAADALVRGAARLVEHAELWQVARARIAALRSEQEAERVAASRRVAVPFDPLAPAAGHVDDVLAALAAAEAARAAEHRRLLALVADDAGDTARVLRSCGAAVGAAGRRGGTGREVAHLAALLPGWGAAELTARGHALARVLRDGDPARSEARAADSLALAGDAAFATALLAGLGVEGVAELLLGLDHVELGEGSALARVLAAAFGSVAVPARGDRRTAAVLAARYVDPADPSTVADQVARGLAIVARSGARHDGPAPRTVAGWTRQVALREAAVGEPLPDRLGFLADDAESADPLHGLAVALAAQGDGRAAAALLADRPVWTHLLARAWPDGGEALAAVVASLTGAPDEPARTALRSGLEALGAGLEDGRPDDWAVDRRAAVAVRPGLAEAVSSHLGAITGLLAEVADRRPAADRLAALHGLGFLTIDPAATEALARGLRAWGGRTPPQALTASGAAVLVAVPAAFLAVRHYGQRLAHALTTHALQAGAQRAERRWDATVGLVVEVAMGAAGKRVPLAEPLVGALETGLQRWAGADGQFDTGPDDGARFTGADAAAATAVGGREDGLRHVASAAAGAFGRARAALGEPVAARPPEQVPLAQELLQDLVEQGVPERFAGRGSAAGGRARFGD